MGKLPLASLELWSTLAERGWSGAPWMGLCESCYQLMFGPARPRAICFPFLPQIKTRLEVASEEANTREVSDAQEVVLPSGLRYQDLKIGGGSPPIPGGDA